MKDKKTKDKVKEEKEKKKKLPFARTAANTVFALRQVYDASHLYFLFYFINTMIYAPLDFLTGSYLIKVIVDGVEKSRAPRQIYTYILVVGLVSILIDMINSFFWNYVNAGMYQKIGGVLAKKLMKKSSEVELACYEQPEFYDKYVKAMDEAYSRVNKVMRTVDNLIWQIISLLCNSFLLFFIDPWLILFGLFPLLLGFVRRWQNKLRHDQSSEEKKIKRRMKYVRRTFYLDEYAKEMRIGGMYVRMLNELMATFEDYRELQRRYGTRLAVAKFVQNVGLEVVTVLGAMVYAAWRTVGDGSMSIGDCIVIFNSIGTISYCLNNMVQNFAEFGEHALFIEDVRFFLDYETKMPDDPSAPAADAGDITFENVSFRYEGAEKDSLHDISLHITPGEKIALVGQNGSGKTTLVKLLLRMYDPTSGRVTLGGKNIRDCRLSSYRDLYSCVFQDFRLFSMSVRENVVLRREREGDAELVTDALRESGGLDKVLTLDQGIETTLTREFDKKGANLSVGEQQKVSLARVFADRRPFIILDEPSSALDPIAEHKMFENMMRAAEGRTVIFISHRLSSAVDADRIFLMEGGTITETGTHHELMQKGGKYAEMFHLQAANYVGDGEEAAV